MNSIAKLLTIIGLTITTTMIAPAVQRPGSDTTDRLTVAAHAESVKPPIKNKDAPKAPVVAETAPPAPEPAPLDPNGCEAQGMHWRADNYACIPNPVPSPAAPVMSSLSHGFADHGGVGSCQDEIAKYGWNQTTALAVASAESGMAPGVVNDNPLTGDYSVGCFQINIFGANALSRPSETELKNAAVNVGLAYKMYVGNGNSFIGQWGVCRKISC